MAKTMSSQMAYSYKKTMSSQMAYSYKKTMSSQMAYSYKKNNNIVISKTIRIKVQFLLNMYIYIKCFVVVGRGNG
jgi:hypothetical protein